MEIASIESLKYKKLDIYESETSLTIKIKELENMNNIDSICNFFNLKKENDKISIEVSQTEELVVFVNKNISDNEDLREFFSYGNKIFDLEINIDKEKRIINETTVQYNIYNYKYYMGYIKNKNPYELIRDFSLYYSNKKKIFLKCEGNNILQTPSLIIGNTCEIDDNFDRIKKINSLIDNINFNGNIRINVLPEDFNIIKYYGEDAIKNFDKARNILSIIYIADSSQFNDNTLCFSILGKKFEDNTFNNDIYFKLYEWIFENENFYEKLILTKNLISETNKIDESILGIIHNNYRILQRRNIDKYFELKKDVAANIIENSEGFANVERNILNIFSKNIVGFFSFVFTIVIVNATTVNKLDNIFTTDIIVILYILFIASLIFLFFTIKQCMRELQRITNTYQKLKSNYIDVFRQEIDELFDDRSFEDQKNKAQKNISIYSAIWGILIILCFLIIEIFFNDCEILRSIFNFFD